MPKANTKTLPSILILLTAVFLFGCSHPEKERQEQLNLASTLVAEGNLTAALEVLEALSTEYPNDKEIILEIADIYTREGNPTVAAFYLDQAYSLDPTDTELLYQTYRLQEQAGNTDAAKTLLTSLSELDPAAMTPNLWIRLGELLKDSKNYEPALKAYLKGINPEKSTPQPETAAAIGDLFIKLNNLPMAERWLTIAADSNDPSAFTALFGLLEINLRNKNWTAAEENIAQLDAQFPGALDISEWASTRDELAKWRAAQNKMNEELAAAKQTTEDSTVEVVDNSAGEVSESIPTEIAESDSAEASQTTEISDATVATESKSQIVDDIENMIAVVDTPAIETGEYGEFGVVAFDPSIAIEPADPNFNLGVTFDQQAQGAQAPTISVGNVSPPAESVAPAPAPAPRPVTNLKSTEELLLEADIANQNLNYKSAIRSYWQALGRANNRADIWSMLSKTYLADGQARNAETAALEATRLAPSELGYTLDYLRVVQTTKTPSDFIAELETAYTRFPRSPEITLSLARAYDRISSNSAAASTYYNRFIEIAPNHPLRNEAEAALVRLP